MWPGDQQSGGPQHPQGSPHPPQQPPGGYGEPNPYAQPGPNAQPGFPQQPAPPYGQPAYPPAQPYGTQNPYAQPGHPPQPGGHPVPQQWGPPVPGGPGGPPPRREHGNLTVAIAVTAAVAVIAAVVAGAVYLTGDRTNEAHGDPTTTTPYLQRLLELQTSDPAVSGGSSDAPRGAPVDVAPVVPGWKVVERDERNVLFDVPPDWTVDSQGMTIGFEDKDGNPAVAMGAPAYYKHDWCKTANGTADRAVVGTKGANGATSVRDAAEVQAESWAYWAYQDNGKGTFSKAQNSKAFHNAYGITGWQAQATATGIPKTNRCAADGEAWTVAWIDPTQTDPTKKLVVWVLYADRAVPDALAQATIDRIKSTIRPIKK